MFQQQTSQYIPNSYNGKNLFRLHNNESVASILPMNTPRNSLSDIHAIKLPKIKQTHVDLKTIKLLPVAYSSEKIGSFNRLFKKKILSNLKFISFRYY